MIIVTCAVVETQSLIMKFFKKEVKSLKVLANFSLLPQTNDQSVTHDFDCSDILLPSLSA